MTESSKPSPQSSPDSPVSDTIAGHDFLPSDSIYSRFKNFWRMASGSMSPDGQKQYWEDADRRYSEIDCRRCESQRDYLLQYSPIIRYMSENIKRLGGDLGKHNIRCRTCTTGQLGGFDHKYGIMLCANWVDKRNMLEDVMAHEMVHAYDHLRFKTDLGPDADLKHIACSEVPSSHFLHRDTIAADLSLPLDPCQQPQWGMSMGQRILPEQGHGLYQPPSRLREEKSYHIGQEQTQLQG